MKYLIAKLLFFTRAAVIHCVPKEIRRALKKLRILNHLYKQNGPIYENFIDEWTSESKKTKILPSLIHNFPTGINLIGCFRSLKGVSQSARGLALSLQHAETGYSIVDVDLGIPSDQLTEIIPKPENGFTYSVNVLAINPPDMPYAYGVFGKNQMIRNWSIGHWYWELEKIPDSWNFAIELVDEIWVASSFQMKNFQRVTSKPVCVIPPSVCIEENLNRTRVDFNIPLDQFLFLSACDSNSLMERKNPLGVIQAFKLAFDNNSNVGLVLKIYNAEVSSSQMEKIYQEIDGMSNVYLITDPLSRVEMLSLINVVDSYVSLHRAEGFGLIQAEAMALGKPVIMTYWSGNTDMMTGKNCIGIEYKLVKIEQDQGPYKKGEIWAEPDLNQAVDSMRLLFDNSDICQQIGVEARQTIKNLYSPEIVGKKIAQRVREIGG